MLNKPILVQLRDNQSTIEVIHLASAIAHDYATHVRLVRMVAVQYVNWLGTDLGKQPLSVQECEVIRSCKAITQEYGVAFDHFDFQYVTLAEALVQAVAYVKAQALFATLPPIAIPAWRRFQNWQIKHQLAALGCEFYTLADDVNGSGDVSPAILVRARKKITSTL
jgi:hypothetical protein